MTYKYSIQQNYIEVSVAKSANGNFFLDKAKIIQCLFAFKCKNVLKFNLC